MSEAERIPSRRFMVTLSSKTTSEMMFSTWEAVWSHRNCNEWFKTLSSLHREMLCCPLLVTMYGTLYPLSSKKPFPMGLETFSAIEMGEDFPSASFRSEVCAKYIRGIHSLVEFSVKLLKENSTPSWKLSAEVEHMSSFESRNSRSKVTSLSGEYVK